MLGKREMQTAFLVGNPDGGDNLRELQVTIKY
jgi:hypothetical protein